MIPIILSGGSGTRLWPLSRGQYPKQFLPLASQNTMIQETILRLHGIDNLKPPIAVCNEDHRFMLAEQMWEIGIKPTAIMLEPVGKNTAPAIAVAALSVNEDDVIMVLPADHVITDLNAFHSAIKKAEELAQKGQLVTFGIVPHEPETGYGYIKRSDQQMESAYLVDSFVEKPDLEKAKQYLASGDYYWNSGMFVFKAGRFIEELNKFNPEIVQVCRKSLEKAQKDLDFTRLDKDEFSLCPSDSIDYAVMEKTDMAVVVPLDAGWNDVGSWTALWDITKKDETGNAVFGDIMTIDTENSYLYSKNKLVAAIGVRDLVIVETDDALLVAHKDKVQDVKNIVHELKQKGRAEADNHRKIYRPWGHYDCVDIGERHQTKRIVVKPGAKLSLQKHHHRAEHWIVVKGTAMVTKGDQKVLISENESIYIPLGTLHCLENPGVIPLEMVEVQSGSYLGEDDIVRYEDQYGRI